MSSARTTPMKARRGWLRRLLDMPNDSPVKTLAVTLIVALLASVLVAGSAVVLRPLQIANKEAERQSHIVDIVERLHIVEIIKRLPGVGERFEVGVSIRLEARVVDLATGDYAPDIDANLFDQRRAARDPQLNVAIPPELDAAGLKWRSRLAVVYLVHENDRLRLVVLPVHGKGYASTLYGYLGLEPDAETVVGLNFYEHAETPGIGSMIDEPAWRQQWYGKKIADPAGIVRLGVAAGPLDPASPDAPYQVDGLTGATWTSNGVTHLLRYWLGDDGFGPYLRKLRKQRG